MVINSYGGRQARGAARAAGGTPVATRASCRAAAAATRQGAAAVRRRLWRTQGLALRGSMRGADPPRSSADVAARGTRSACEATRSQRGDLRHRRPVRRPRGLRASTSAVASVTSRARALTWPAPCTRRRRRAPLSPPRVLPRTRAHACGAARQCAPKASTQGE